MVETGTIGERLAHARPRRDDLERRRLRAELGTRLLGEPNRLPRTGRYVLQRPVGTGAMGVVYSAFDPSLHRNVAVKVLEAPKTLGDVDHRLLSEAQALAKLSDPNIVPVYDVGELDGRLWIAMELVEGQTLREWLHSGARSWSEVLAVMLAAGRGLAGAHAAGLVHRDFKPENVMIGDDGRVRIMDLGLALLVEAAHREDGPTLHPSQDPSSSSPPAAGTPAYMAPELFEGRPASERSDQFGYCIAFWEALFGVHPALDPPALPPSGRQVPRWLRSIVRRGLEPDPSRRWEDMKALLCALEGGQARTRRRRRWTWIGVATAAAATLTLGRRVEQHHREQVCDRSGDVVEQFWNPKIRADVVTGLGAVDVPHAGTTADAVAQMLATRAERWARARADACVAHDVEQRWSEDRLERARWCLDDVRFEFRAQTLRLTEADRRTANRAFGVVSRLRPLGDCLDPMVLDHQPAVPHDRRGAVADVRERLAAAAARLGAGAHDEEVAWARDLVGDAEAAGWAPLSAKTRVLEASFLRESSRYDEAIEAAQAAYFQAVRIPAWDVAADAAIVLVAIAANLGRRELGQMWHRHARVALGHGHGTVDLRTQVLLNNLGILYTATGEYDEARTTLEQALRRATDAFGEDHPEVSTSLLNLATVEYETGHYERARELLERAVRIRERALGPDHLEVSIALANLATILSETGHADEAREVLERVLAVQEANLGPDHPRVSQVLNNLAISYSRSGDLDRAMELHERALSIRERRLGPDHPQVATSLDNLAQIHSKRGEPHEAIALQERALEIRERVLGPEHPDVADTLNNLGVELLRQGNRTRARALIERGLSVRESTLGPDHPLVAVSLTNLAALEDDMSRVLEIDRRILSIREAALGPDHPEVARVLTNLALDSGVDTAGSLELLERAVAIFDAHRGRQPREGAARFGLARALEAGGQEPSRARTLAEEALGAHRAERNATQVARVEAWLAAAARKPLR